MEGLDNINCNLKEIEYVNNIELYVFFGFEIIYLLLLYVIYVFLKNCYYNKIRLKFSYFG